MHTAGHMQEAKVHEALPADMKDASDTLAYTGLKKISKLFAIEKEIDTFPPEDKVKYAPEKVKTFSRSLLMI